MKLLTWEVGHEDDLRVVGGVVESFLDLGQLASPVRQADEQGHHPRGLAEGAPRGRQDINPGVKHSEWKEREREKCFI